MYPPGTAYEVFYDPTLHIPDNLTLFIGIIFWVVIFIIALNETSSKNRRGK